MEEKKGTEGEGKGCCCCGGGSRCCGKKALLGGLIALILTGAGFGLYHAGKCAGRMCPVAGQVQQAK
ncbi:MAG: hypothetical protein HY399_01425 [Elusimicrobia bacterium]|nr:hypothetical protein [Elusimicrobiota bacterium]